MDKKKELLFKYFTRFQGEELKFDNINDGYSPGGDSSKIIFDINYSTLYFDTIWAETDIGPMFNVDIDEFKIYLKEWFESHHKLNVKTVL